ncbi:MAG: DUF4003 family protein [Clostridia bacterium]|nr:DUF4003 family protein [Clostridia bacterium]
MSRSYEELARYYVQNLNALVDAYGREDGMLYPVCAGILLERTRPITAEELKGLRTHIRFDDDFTGDFKGSAVVPVACLLAASDHPEELTVKAPALYRKLVEHMPRSSFLALTVLALADGIPEDRVDEYVEKANRIYELLEKTGKLDHEGEGFVAALLAMTNKSPELAAFDAHDLLDKLKPLFPLRSSARAVALTLALSGRSNEADLRHIRRLMTKLHTAGMKLGGNHSMGLLGALAFCKFDNAGLVERLRDAELALSREKPYRGLMAVSRKRRLIHAAILVSYRAAVGDPRFKAAYRAALCIILADALSAY